ncbi:MAG: U32 family peptidase [Bacteroidales bacterium]|nr:U32 family peptidase [Bacteroidales bacterium]
MCETRYIELLAPAKNLEVGRVAIDSGADAVYIGGPAFGARKAAGNSLEDIAELCRYAHIFGVRVFTTLNTLLRDDEMDEAVRLACAFRQIGVDAILIQDLRLARVLLEMGGFEHLLHASTQCDVRDLRRVQELENMGFSQVVLARELSYAEMKHIREHTTVALEAFVHGALCVSYSGACYLSEAVCGRSANRGECAQMCRLTYDVLDENKRELLHQKHVLSLRDLDRSHHLRELLYAGITTFKIEGRLKDADYVRNVVAYYRGLLDDIFRSSTTYAQASRGITRIQFKPDPAKTFHRGATEYFSFFSAGDTPDKRPADLVNMDTPKSTGEFLGYTPIKNSWGLQNGDGLVVGDQGFYWPSRQRFPEGLPVYRTYNADFQRQLSAKDATKRVLPVKILFSDTPDGFSIEITPTTPAASTAYAAPAASITPSTPISSITPTVHTSPTSSTSSTSPTIHPAPIAPILLSFPAEKVPATNADRAEAVVRQQLGKLGDTPFEASEVDIRWSQPYFLPASTLNSYRRTAVDALITALTQIPHAPATFSIPATSTSATPATPATPISSAAPIPSAAPTTPISPIGPIIPTSPTSYTSSTSSTSSTSLTSPTIRPSLISPISPIYGSSPLPSALMTCRYCLLHELGCCKRLNPRKTGVPTYLRRGDLLLRIQTDCRSCLMTLETP